MLYYAEINSGGSVLVEAEDERDARGKLKDYYGDTVLVRRILDDRVPGYNDLVADAFRSLTPVI